MTISNFLKVYIPKVRDYYAWCHLLSQVHASSYVLFSPFFLFFPATSTARYSTVTARLLNTMKMCLGADWQTFRDGDENTILHRASRFETKLIRTHTHKTHNTQHNTHTHTHHTTTPQHHTHTRTLTTTLLRMQTQGEERLRP